MGSQRNERADRGLVFGFFSQTYKGRLIASGLPGQAGLDGQGHSGLRPKIQQQETKGRRSQQMLRRPGSGHDIPGSNYNQG
jgi:hypothetical protein